MSETRRARHPQVQRPHHYGSHHHGPPPPPPPARKGHRVFLWSFLAIQVIFIAWVVAGLASGSGTAEACSGLTGDSLKVCEDTDALGTTIGVGLIVGIWLATDFIVAVMYAMYRLAARPPRPRPGPGPGPGPDPRNGGPAAHAR